MHNIDYVTSVPSYRMLNQEDEMEQDMKTIMSSLEDLKMEATIHNRFKEFSFDSYVRGFHVYKDIWDPRMGKTV